MIELTESLVASLQKKAHVPPAPLASMIRAAKNDAIDFAQFIIQDGYLDRDTAGDLLARVLNRTYVNLSKTLFQDELVSLLTGEVARHYQAIPIYQLGEVVTVGMVNPNNQKSVTELGNLLMKPISPVFCFKDEINSAIQVNYQSAQRVEDMATSFDLKVFQTAELSDSALEKLLNSKPLVELGNSIILLAMKERASDIHIEPKRNEVVVRFRIDGDLVDKLFLPAEMALPLVSRYKISSGMDITERRRPQDGRLSFELPNQPAQLKTNQWPVNATTIFLNFCREASLATLAEMSFTHGYIEKIHYRSMPILPTLGLKVIFILKMVTAKQTTVLPKLKMHTPCW
jgi:type IV pilus assembly protein PilB